MQQQVNISQPKAALQVKCGSCNQVINGGSLPSLTLCICPLCYVGMSSCAGHLQFGAGAFIILHDHHFTPSHETHIMAQLVVHMQYQLKSCHSLLRSSSSAVRTAIRFRMSTCRQKWLIRSSVVSISTSTKPSGSFSNILTGISMARCQGIMMQLH